MKEEKELTYGETIKQPLPKLEDIEWVKVEVPEWFFGDRANGLISNQKYNCEELSSWAITSTVYNEMKKVHENSKDFKVTWQLKQPTPHADIKAEYEKDIAEGKIVKVFAWAEYNENLDKWVEQKLPSWQENIKYKLQYYNIDWNKLLSWSYANGEFVGCEFSDDNFRNLGGAGNLRGIDNTGKFMSVLMSYKNCRLAKGVEIKDEWLKEIK